MADDIRALFRARAADDGVAVLFEDQQISWREHVQASLDRAAWLLAHRPKDGPFHVGVLLDNVPEFSYLLGAAAFAGATIVGINPTRRGAEFERDVQHTDCAMLVTEPKYQTGLVGLELGPAANALHVIGSEAWADTRFRLAACRRRELRGGSGRAHSHTTPRGFACRRLRGA